MKTEITVIIGPTPLYLVLDAPISVPVLNICTDCEVLVATVFNGYNCITEMLQYKAVVSLQRVSMDRLLAVGFKPRRENEETQERRA